MNYALPMVQGEQNWRKLVSAASSCAVANFLPNCQWQMWTGVTYITKQKADGTGAQTAITATGFSTASNNPTFTTANTRDVRVGDLVVVSGGGFQWGYAGVGYIAKATANRIAALVANTSVTFASSPLGGVTPVVSVATTLTPIAPGNSAATSGSADGWTKSSTATVWADDWAVNACPGAIRTMGYRKGSASTETLASVVQPNQLGVYRGRWVTFGVLVYQKVQSGAGTWRISINDGVTTTYSETSGKGVVYNDPEYAGFEFLTVTKLLSMSLTGVTSTIEFNGANADVYYVALPTLVFSPALNVAACGLPVHCLFDVMNHWNPPLLTPLAMDFPAVEYIGGSGLYGFSGQDLEAMSLGTMHNSVVAVEAKIELETATVDATLFTGSRLSASSLLFGPQQFTVVAGTRNAGSGRLPLAGDGTFSLFVNVPSLTIDNATFDFWSAQLSGSSAAT